MELKEKLKQAIENCDPLSPSDEQKMLTATECKNLVKKYLLTFPVSKPAFEKLLEDMNLGLLKLCVKSAHLYDYEQVGFVKMGDVELFEKLICELNKRKMPISPLAQEAIFALPHETRLKFFEIFSNTKSLTDEGDIVLVKTGDDDLIRCYLAKNKFPQPEPIQLAIFNLNKPELIAFYLDNIEIEKVDETKEILCQEAQVLLVDMQNAELLEKYLKKGTLCVAAKARLLDTKNMPLIEAYFNLLHYYG